MRPPPHNRLYALFDHPDEVRHEFRVGDRVQIVAAAADPESWQQSTYIGRFGTVASRKTTEPSTDVLVPEGDFVVAAYYVTLDFVGPREVSTLFLEELNLVPENPGARPVENRELAGLCRWCWNQLTNEGGVLVDETGGDVCAVREHKDPTQGGNNPPHQLH